MKINGISASNLQFKGLWGKSHYSHSETLYGGEFKCDYYEKAYHPCADETYEQIQKALNKKREQLKSDNVKGSQGANGYYIYVVEGTPLKITNAQLAELKNKSKNILAGNLPEKDSFNLFG